MRFDSPPSELKSQRESAMPQTFRNLFPYAPRFFPTTDRPCPTGTLPAGASRASLSQRVECRAEPEDRERGPARRLRRAPDRFDQLERRGAVEKGFPRRADPDFVPGAGVASLRLR